MAERMRLTRADGKQIYLPRKRGHIEVCAKGCCCGRVDRNFPEVPIDFYKAEYKRRRLRPQVQLTMSGCLGPCPMANVVLLTIDGNPIWLQSVQKREQIVKLFDYVEMLLEAGESVVPPPELADLVFDYYAWADTAARLQDGNGPVLPVPPLDPGARDILFLSHAETDLLTLRQVIGDLPEDFPRVRAIGLTRLGGSAGMSPSTLRATVRPHLVSSAVVVARLHGGLAGVEGMAELVAELKDSGREVLLISGVGTFEPELAAASSVAPELLHNVLAYLSEGGHGNVVHCLRFLADRLYLTTFGYDPPHPQPLHGIYHPDLGGMTDMASWLDRANEERSTVGLLFYRAHWMSGNLTFVDELVRAIEDQGAHALPVFTSSLRDLAGADEHVLLPFLCDEEGRPRIDVLISTLAFAMTDRRDTPVCLFERLGVPVLQAICAGQAHWQWDASPRGLLPVDVAMNVALPEYDGRLITVPISFKEPFLEVTPTCEGCTEEACAAEEPNESSMARPEALHYQPCPDRVDRVAGLAASHARLRHLPNAEKRIAIILTNAPGSNARLGGAVGLDTPASLVSVLGALSDVGYVVDEFPTDSDRLFHEIVDRGTYDDDWADFDPTRTVGRVAADIYRKWFDELPQETRSGVLTRWGEPPGAFGLHDGDLCFAGLELGNVLIAPQPPRGYGMDPTAIYHQPDLPPTHHYVAFYLWLQKLWQADAIVHLGKHGTLEWLPGKGVGLSASCAPDLLLADVPLFYPFIVNDPGEGSQAKRRAHAAIVDHLTPPMTHGGHYGRLERLAQLVDEYYQVEMLDPSKLPLLQQQIWTLIREANLEEDLKFVMVQDHGDHKHEWDEGFTPEGTPLSLSSMQGRDVAHLIEDLDGYLCELAGAQIRDGLHVLGELPRDEQLVGLLHALLRLPNLEAASLRHSVAESLGLSLGDLEDRPGRRLTDVPATARRLSLAPVHTAGDLVETVDERARSLLRRLAEHDFAESSVRTLVAEELPAVDAVNVEDVLRFVCRELVPRLHRTSDEIAHLLAGLEGRFIPPGPSGAPTRGMAHVLPTGRNFFAVDPRAVPSPAAWNVGQALATEMLKRYRSDAAGAGELEYPETVGISMWGTSAMRTGGDDVAQVLALMGVRPAWQPHNRRLTGIEVIPLEELGRPRIDVVVRISGFFRDAFPHLIRLLDEAVETVARLEEPTERNFVRKHFLRDYEEARDEGDCETDAQRKARYRVFGSPPNAYGAGILPLIEQQNWRTSDDFAEAYVNWGGYAYTAEEEGVDRRDVFRSRLATVQVALHNQDNREHDIFDSDDYLQFHGGMIATIRALTGKKPRHFFGDSSDPSRPVVRDLKQEALRVFRSRVVNPKWIESLERHGYKGGLELNATVDYLFGFDATADVVDDWMYEEVAEQYVFNENVRRFLEQSNPWALRSIAQRLLEADQRGLFSEPKPETRDALQATLLESEAWIEERSEHTREPREILR